MHLDQLDQLADDFDDPLPPDILAALNRESDDEDE